MPQCKITALFSQNIKPIHFIKEMGSLLDLFYKRFFFFKIKCG